MRLSEVSVRRPVFAAVLSLILIILGILALDRLAIREYPDISSPVVSISTTYRGASAEIVERKLTQVIEDQVAGIAGVKKITSSSRDERSSITVEFNLDRDADGAANDVRERVSRILQALPEEADAPEVTKQDDFMDASLFINVSSRTRSVMELTDYAERNLIDRLTVLPGVATIRLSGSRRYAMRIWLDREALAARRLTVQDVEEALRRENVELPAGRIESTQREFTLRTDTGLKDPEEFQRLVVGRSPDGYLVRLGEVADVRVEPESLRNFSRSSGVPGITLGIVNQSQANVLAVNRHVRDEMERMLDGIPDDMIMGINIDFSVFIRESLTEVMKALGVALLLVLVVIFSFLGSIRATLIPALTIPVAIVSSFMVMAFMGYSVNTLTLLGLVLAIGLVVDDAIVVLENIVRRMELGQPPLLAAVDGSREIGFAVVATTVVLVSVFIPISFMPGAVGRLFGEFGISLAAAVAFSSLVALTLVPMLGSKLFANGINRRGFSNAVDRFFRWLTERYRRVLEPMVRRPWIALIAVAVTGGTAAWIFDRLPTEYAPPEDRGMMLMFMTAPEGSTPEYMDRQVRKAEDILMPYVESGQARRVLARSGGFGAGGDVNSAFMYIPLESRDKRTLSASDMAAEVQAQVTDIPGIFARAILPPSLAVRGAGQPLQVILGGTNYDELADWRDRVLARVWQNRGILGMRSDYQETKPKIRVSVDRDRAADLGVSLQTVGGTLETMLGSRIVTTYMDRGEEYNVILQATPEDRATPSDLNNIYVRSTQTEQLVPLAALVKFEETSGPRQLNRFDQLRSIKLTGALAPGYSLGEALKFMEDVIREELPESVRINYDGESREYMESGNTIYYTFLLALLLAFLVLSAQFESFVHPMIIMFTVPLALMGGLLGLWLFDSSINVFSQIGGIMLIGLAAKNGILIVEFANQLRDRGREFLDAIVEAATIRLRPVVMTSMCTAFGAVPLILASAAGAEARRTLGAVIFFGVTISVFLTLFIVPSIYALMARRTKSPETVGRAIDGLRKLATSRTDRPHQEQPET